MQQLSTILELYNLVSFTTYSLLITHSNKFGPQVQLL